MKKIFIKTRWVITWAVLSFAFVFLPRSEELGFSPFRSREKMGLIYGIYNPKGEILYMEIVINVFCAALATLVIYACYKLVVKRRSLSFSLIILSVFLLLFLFFPGTEEGRDTSNCSFNASCAGVPIDVRTYGLIKDTFTHSYADPISPLEPDLPIIFWNTMAAVSIATVLSLIPLRRRGVTNTNSL